MTLPYPQRLAWVATEMNVLVEWPIQEVAGFAGVTSRTLRHYDSIGLLSPTRIGSNGYRYYDERSLLRLQRILLLRELGLGLPTIAEVIDGNVDDRQALRQHVRWLEGERSRIQEQIRSVSSTLQALEKGETMMAETMFEGFDYTRYRDEVKERWGKDASQRADTWWKGLRADGQRDFLGQHLTIQDDYDAALMAGEAPTGERVQEIAGRHYEWIVRSWQGKRPDAAALAGLTEMYVCDPRFAQHYTRVDPSGAEFVREALLVYAEQNLKVV